jgi:hypothetical protein
VGWCQPGRIHGEILVGPDRIPVSGTGFHSRASGVLDWWSGRLHQRMAWVRADGDGVVYDGRVDQPAQGSRSQPETVLGRVPLLVTAPGRPPVKLARSLCRVGGADGGTGWAEWFPA